MGFAQAASTLAPQPFLSARLERVFSDCFADSWNTQLCGGAEEPFYQPAVTSGEYHALFYRHDYFASALHEVAHWCIAGPQRRQQPDFGYWYTPETRSAEQQRAFEAVECRPQALEWFFSRACGYRFTVSIDNLELARIGKIDAVAFQRCVLEQALTWQAEGLPGRAIVFYRALCCEFGSTIPASQLHFTLPELA
jgi:elongation factor P hydroxylase